MTLKELEQKATDYYKGNGVEKDIEKALSLYSKAAENNSGLGNYQLGRAYETGTGKDIDIIKAKHFYEKAVGCGYKNAENKLKALKTEYTINDATTTKKTAPHQRNQYVASELPNQSESATSLISTANTINTQSKSKTLAAILALVFGGFGVHNFYLKNTKKAVIQLILGITLIGLTVSQLWAFIECIMLATGRIPCDSNGIELI